MVAPLSATDRRQEEDLRAVAHRRVEAACVSDVFPIDEDVDVRTHFSELGQDPVADTGTLGPQPQQGFRHRTGRSLDADLRPVAGNLAQRARNDEEDSHQTTAVLTEMTGGSPSSKADQVCPSSEEPNSFPLRVPKYTPGA